jgi:hypothetical protein
LLKVLESIAKEETSSSKYTACVVSRPLEKMERTV